MGPTMANMIFALCRTDPDVPKHDGISFLLVPMDQPGVEVRPIEDMGAHAHVDEVFFEDARTGVENVLGETNGGWAVANTLLGFERGGRGTVLWQPFREELDNFIELDRAGTIYGGSTEVQKGILGERMLGLPKEPRADAGSWREIQLQ